MCAAVALVLGGASGIAQATEPAPSAPAVAPLVDEPSTTPSPTPTPEPTPTDPAPTPTPTPEPTPEPKPEPKPDPKPKPEPKPKPDLADKVVFSIDGKTITKFVKVPAGSILKINKVAPGSTIAVHEVKNKDNAVRVSKTSKNRLYKTEPLAPATRYWAKVVAKDGSKTRVNFRTLPAERAFTVSVSPRSGSGVYGVGMPIRVTFGIPIVNKAAVERALNVVSTQKLGASSWHWMSSTEAVFRPKKLLPGNAKITVKADLRSVEGAAGWYGPKVNSSFRTGDAVVLKTNFKNLTMKYIRNGKVERTFPISGGKKDWETKNGTKLITTHEKQRRLVNPDPVEGWDVLTNYAMRLTQDGEFIHDAPWNYSIGRYNNSHGCTNMTTADAKWVFENTRFGDVVKSSGASVRVSKSEYLAGYWNYSWKEWKAGSAL